MKARRPAPWPIAFAVVLVDLVLVVLNAVELVLELVGLLLIEGGPVPFGEFVGLALRRGEAPDQRLRRLRPLRSRPRRRHRAGASLSRAKSAARR